MWKNWQRFGAFSPNVRLYLISWALIGFSSFGIQAVLLNLYLLRLGYGPEFLGYFIAAGQLVWALMALPAAVIGRRIGLERAIQLGFLLTTLGFALLLFVERLPTPLWISWLVSTWLLSWIGGALITVNSIPYLMTVAGDDERNYAFSAQTAAITLMGFIGSIVAGLLPSLVASWLGVSPEDAAAYRYVLFLVPLIHFANLLLWMRSPHVQLEENQISTATAEQTPWAIFFFYGLVGFLIAISEGAIRAFFNVYLDVALHVTTSRIGLIMGVGSLVPIVAVIILPAILARWGSAGALLLAAVGTAIGVLLLGALPTWVVATAGFIVALSAIALSGPSRSLWGQEIVVPKWRATTSAIATIALALGWAVAAALGGQLVDEFGFRGMFALTAIVALLAALLLALYLRQQKALIVPLEPLPKMASSPSDR